MATKKIKLGVREFDIPELAIRQRRVVVPLVITLQPAMDRVRQEKSIAHLKVEDYSNMQEIVYQGITRGQPKLEREAFLDFVFDEVDLITALGVVIAQAGFAAETSVGEASGEAAPAIPPTGTSTSTT